MGKEVVSKKTKSPSRAKKQVDKPSNPGKSKRVYKPRSDAISSTQEFVLRSEITGQKLYNEMITQGSLLRKQLLSADRRCVVVFHLDPGYINGGACLTLVDLSDPDACFSFLWKIDLYEGASKGAKDAVTDEEINDRMCDYIQRYRRMFDEVDICNVEAQLKMTEFDYADTYSKQMSHCLQFFYRMFHAKKINVFAAAITHNMYPWVYPDFVDEEYELSILRIQSAKMPKVEEARQLKEERRRHAQRIYRHNKRCSAAAVSNNNIFDGVKKYVSLAAERALVDEDMRYHQQIRNEREKKYDDYGDAFMQKRAFLEILAADNNLLRRREGNQKIIESHVYIFVLPQCTFINEPTSICRYMDTLIIVLKHDVFPFMPRLRKMNSKYLHLVELNNPTQFDSWSKIRQHCVPTARATNGRVIDAEMLAFLYDGF